jgi:isoamylase
LLSQGVPMICHGDELGRTQNGNNNGYCQDNELTWIEWADADTGLLEFTAGVSALRASHPVFRRRRFFSGKPMGRRGQDGLPDISWFAPDGTEMTAEDWGAGFAKSVAVFLNGHGIPDLDPRGQRVLDDSFLLCFNAHYEPIEFTLPPKEFGAGWRTVVCTADGAAATPDELSAAASFTVDAHTAVVLQAESGNS